MTMGVFVDSYTVSTFYSFQCLLVPLSNPRQIPVPRRRYGPHRPVPWSQRGLDKGTGAGAGPYGPVPAHIGSEKLGFDVHPHSILSQALR
jgi:hypothetical protein